MGGLTKEEMTLGGNCGGGILGEFGPFGPDAAAGAMWTICGGSLAPQGQLAPISPSGPEMVWG